MDEKLKKLAQNIKPNISNRVIDNKLIINLSGSVGEPYWFEDEEDFINEKHVRSLVNDTDKDIVIKLNSPGGDVFEGIAVYNYLKNLDNNVIVEVTALAASAASIIAMAGDEILMNTGSQMMVHEASTITWGNKSDHYKAINALESVDESLVSVYAERTGLDRGIISDWLTDEKWFTAEEAVEQGLADGMTEVKDVVSKEIYLNNKIVEVFSEISAPQEEYPVVASNVDVDKIAAQVMASIEAKYGFENKKAKPAGLNKLFGGK